MSVGWGVLASCVRLSRIVIAGSAIPFLELGEVETMK